ncbi:MAG: PEGA domain-containing protein, partial [Vicinamibacterales bacterium]
PFITQLAGAIDFARAAGVGHGGLHPRDVFVTPDEARATGFGVVEALEQVGIRAPIRRPYSAPERIAGANWGTPADVFSLAAITFELLTARRPAGAGAQIGALPDGDGAAALHGVLARAMDDDPSRRYPTALAFAGALESAGRDGTQIASAAGEFAVGKALDPGATAIDDVTLHGAAADLVLSPDVIEDGDADDDMTLADKPDDRRSSTAPTLFDDDPDDTLGDMTADLAEPERFADDFVAAEDEPPSFLSPADIPVVRTATPPFLRETEPARTAGEETRIVVAAPALAAGETDRDAERYDVPERSGFPILPFGLGLVLGLLIGFAAGYFVLTRDRLVAAPRVATPASPPATTGPATPQSPGQYSEQRVTRPGPGGNASPPPRSAAAASAAPAVSPPPRNERPATTGRLVVRSTPAGAAVTLDGRWRGRTPLTLDLGFGTYVVRVVRDGFRVAREQVTLSSRDSSQTIDARLQRTAPAAAPPRPSGGTAAPRSVPAGAPASFTGSLFVDSRPRGATVLLDGASVGVTPLSLPAVPVGTHVVRIEMAGRKTWSTSARIVSGKLERVTGSLEDR